MKIIFVVMLIFLSLITGLILGGMPRSRRETGAKAEVLAEQSKPVHSGKSTYLANAAGDAELEPSLPVFPHGSGKEYTLLNDHVAEITVFVSRYRAFLTGQLEVGDIIDLWTVQPFKDESSRFCVYSNPALRLLKIHSILNRKMEDISATTGEYIGYITILCSPCEAENIVREAAYGYFSVNRWPRNGSNSEYTVKRNQYMNGPVPESVADADRFDHWTNAPIYYDPAAAAARVSETKSE